MRAAVLTFKRARRLRRELTLPEILLWQALRRGSLAGHQFRRQHPVGPYILDFFCTSRSLAIEVDGASHDHPEQFEHDLRRSAWLKSQGVTVLRFQAHDILDVGQRDAVCEEILAALKE